MKFCMQKYFCQPGKHTIFHQGHKGSKAKGLKVIKARGQEILKSIFLAFYSSVSPLHPILRHNVPNITEPMEIANCGAFDIYHGLVHVAFQEEKMDVDEQGKKKEDDYEEALNDPAVLQVRKIEL